MPALIEHRVTPAAIPIADVAETPAARASLRAQIDRLERRLSAVTVELGSAGRWQPLPDIAEPRPSGPPRLLGMDELEEARDALVNRVDAAERVLQACVRHETGAQILLERVIRNPGEYRGVVIPLAELGEPGCGAYQVRPRLGLLGMLFDWWCVKLSSGCP